MFFLWHFAWRSLRLYILKQLFSEIEVYIYIYAIIWMYNRKRTENCHGFFSEYQRGLYWYAYELRAGQVSLIDSLLCQLWKGLSLVPRQSRHLKLFFRFMFTEKLNSNWFSDEVVLCMTRKRLLFVPLVFAYYPKKIIEEKEMYCCHCHWCQC